MPGAMPEGEAQRDRESDGSLQARGQPTEAEDGRILAVRGLVQQFRGPLPPPAVLRGYDEVVPGGAERILAMAERQAAHRQNIESRGQLFGFSLAASAIGGAFLAVAAGVPLAGVAGVIVAVATLSGFFIWGRAGGVRRGAPGRKRAGHATQGNASDD